MRSHSPLVTLLVLPITAVLGADGDPCPTDKALFCENGGVCVMGNADYGYHGTLNAPFLGTTSMDLMHCNCPIGFTGVYCERAVVTCGQNDHACFHGSECVPVDLATGEWQCDCTKALDNFKTFAGKFCEHASTAVCEHGAIKSHSFCVNGGVCKDVIFGDETHQGCDCPDGFKGNFCELDNNASMSSGTGGITVGQNTGTDNASTNNGSNNGSNNNKGSAPSYPNADSNRSVNQPSRSYSNPFSPSTGYSVTFYVLLSVLSVGTLMASVLLLLKVRNNTRGTAGANRAIDEPNDLQLQPDGSSTLPAPAVSTEVTDGVETKDLKDVDII